MGRHRRPRRRLVHHPARGDRSARSQRRGQDQLARAHLGSGPTRRRTDLGVRHRSRHRRTRGASAARLLTGASPAAPRREGRGLRAPRGRGPRPPPPRSHQPSIGRAVAGGPGRGTGPGHGHHVHRPAPTGQAGPGDRPRPEAGAARRAHRRPRPGPARRHVGADPSHRPRVQHHGPAVVAPARRGGAHLRCCGDPERRTGGRSGHPRRPARTQRGGRRGVRR